MGAEINPADIIPHYKFQVSFDAPLSSVATVEPLRDTIEDRLSIPKDHNLRVSELPPADHQDPRLRRCLGNVTFMHFENGDGDPSTLKAAITVDVYEPGCVRRGLARIIRGYDPKAKVWARAEGAKPFEGGAGVLNEPSPIIDPVGGPLVYA